MIRENTGQVALEYLLIFAVAMILIIVFTLPLTEYSIENTLDVSDTLDVKSDLSSIGQAIKQVYGEGEGSRQTVNIQSVQNLNLNIAKNQISTNVKLNDGSTKTLKVTFNSNLDKSSLRLSKGENVIIVEWPVDSENMQISKK